MLASEELDDHGRHPRMWTITAVNWQLENPDYSSRIFLGVEIEDPAKEVEMTRTLEMVEAPDFERAVVAGHELLDKHAHEAGEFSLEIYLTPPRLPHAEQERLGIRDYRLTADARIDDRDAPGAACVVCARAAPDRRRVAIPRSRRRDESSSFIPRLRSGRS